MIFIAFYNYIQDFTICTNTNISIYAHMYQNHLIFTIYTLYISYLHNHLTLEVMYKILPSIFLLHSCETII